MPENHRHKERREEYKAERAELLKSNLDVSERYDKWSLTLAAGALAVSLTFIEKISPHPASNTLFLIGLAWFFLIVSLVSAFISLVTAQHGVLRQITLLDQDYIAYGAAIEKGEDPPPLSTDNPYSAWTTRLNWLTLICFIAGIVFLCCFAYANLPREKCGTAPILPPLPTTNTTQRPV